MAFGIDGLISAGADLIKSYFPPDLSPEQKAKLEEGIKKMQTQTTEKLVEYYENELQNRTSVIKAEANSESWLTRNWRPLTMLTFVAIIANNYILYPYLSLFFHNVPMLNIPPDMYDLLKLGIGGYVVGRSIEKSVQFYKKKDKK
jgi:hypothetical protein